MDTSKFWDSFGMELINKLSEMETEGINEISWSAHEIKKWLKEIFPKIQ